MFTKVRYELMTDSVHLNHIGCFSTHFLQGVTMATYGWLVARNELVENVGLDEARLAGACVTDQDDLERMLQTLFAFVRHRCWFLLGFSRLKALKNSGRLTRKRWQFSSGLLLITRWILVGFVVSSDWDERIGNQIDEFHCCPEWLV